MQTEHDGISIWYGTPDTPGPDKTAPAGVPISITVGVQPLDASNAAEVRYRVNQGSLEMVAARWLRNDPFGKAQYFRASLPAFQPGDYVEYIVVCRCAGRQVPSLEEAEQFTASFRVTEAVDQASTAPTASLQMPLIDLAPTIPPGGATQPILEGNGLTAGEPEQHQPSTLAQAEMAGAKNGDLPVAEQLVELPARSLDEVHRAVLGNLLETSPQLAGKGLQDTLANLYDSHTGTAEEYWSALRQNPAFKQEGIVEDVQWTLQVGALTGYHLPLIAELQHMAQADPDLKELGAFAKLGEDDWRTILRRPQADGKPLALPGEVQGEDYEEKIGNYARMLAGMVEAAFPTQVIAYRMEKDDDPSSPFAAVKTDMQTFFRTNPAFDFRSTFVDEYLKEHQETALTGLSDAPGLVHVVKSMQRVFKMTPRYAEISALLAGGLHSAQNIARLAPSDFVDQYAISLGGPLQARQVYARAQQNAAMALTLFGQLSVAVNQLEPYVITGDPTGRALPGRLGDPIAAEYRNLFGSIDFCNCAHCQSVYSPAAYLVDLLAYMKTIPADWQVSPGSRLSSALDVLLFPGQPAGIHSVQGQAPNLGARRPDIGDIELTCENTNTLLPYVDLVNEILENAVALDAPNPQPTGGVQSIGNWPGNAFKRQTSGTAEELGANPEHLEPLAYTQLRNAVYPRCLPFNLCIEETRTYLIHLGVPRQAIMEAFFDESQSAPAGGGAREALIDGIPSTALSDYSIAREYLDLTSKEVEVITGGSSASAWQLWGLDQSNNSLADPDDGRAKPATGSWDQVLKRVSIFLQQAGCSYVELLELLGTRFINPIQLPPGMSSTFTIGIVSINPQDPATCNLSQLELTHLDREAPSEALGRMHRFLRLQRKLGWTIGDLDRAIAALQPRKNNQSGQLDLTEAFLVQLSHIERLRSTLNVALETMLSWWAPIDTHSYINYTALGQPMVPSLYARLFRNKNVLNPLDPIFPEDAGSLSGKILEHSLALTAALQISAADLVLLVNDASIILRMTSNDQLPDDILNLDNVSQLYHHITLAKALMLSTQDFLSLKALTGSDPFASTQATLRFVQQVETIRSSGFSIAELDYLLRHRALPSINLAPPEASIALVLADIRGGLQRTEAEKSIQPGDAVEIISSSEGLVIQHLAEALQLEVEVVGLLLSIPLEMPDGKLKKVLALFWDMPLTGADGKDDKGPITAATFPQQFNGYTLLHKIAMVVSKLSISPKELRWILHNTAQTGWLDLAKLPLDLSNSAPFATWERLVAAIHLRDSLPTGDPSLFDLFDLAAISPGASSTAKNSAKQAFLEVLSKHANWPLAELETLLGRKDHSDESGLLGLTYPGDYRDERLFVRLQTCFKVLKRLGVSAEQAGDWRKTDIDIVESDGHNAKRAAKAKYREDEWLNVAKPLRDTLREKQRAALVAYLLHSYGLRDPNSLYEHFLIDVEMDPCQMTTRVKQAISSVQLFIQRCQMNMEAGIAMRAEDVRRWKWMKNYRVWEANRKVFFHPENWIEPELRDDKSPFFKELENELMQNDVTMETTETALMQYLEKLDEVSRLEICGMYRQKEGDIDVVHVFGRTRGLPHVYYYRRRIDSSYWTAWEKVDADIEGNHLIPVVWNRRLHLFWPVFSEKLKKRPPQAQAEAPKETTRLVSQWTKWGSSKDLDWAFGLSGDMSINTNQTITNQIIKFGVIVPIVAPPFTVECELDQGFHWDGAQYELRLNFEGERSHVANVIGQPKLTLDGTKVTAFFHVGIDCTQSTSFGWWAQCTSKEAVGSASVQFRVMEYKEIKEPVNSSGQTQPGDPGIEAEKYQEIQLAWSEYRNGKWSGKKVTPKSMKLEILDPPEESRKYFTFRVLAENPLTIGCYRTIKPKLLPPPNANEKGGTLATTPPPGQGTTPPTTVPIWLWQLGEFRLLGSDKYGEVSQIDSSFYDSISPELLIYGASLKMEEGMVTQRDPLEEPKGVVQLPVLDLYNQRILSMTPSQFRLLFPLHSVNIDPQEPFFYQDDTRTFFIAQKTVEVHNPVTDITRSVGDNDVLDIDARRKNYFEKFQNLGIGSPWHKLPALKMPVNPPGDPMGPKSKLPGFKTPINPPGDPNGLRSPALGPDVSTVAMGRPTSSLVNLGAMSGTAGNLRELASSNPSPLLPDEGRRVNPSMAIQPLPVIAATEPAKTVILNVPASSIEHTVHSIGEVADSIKPWNTQYQIAEINTEQRYQFQVFYHPFVGEFIRQLNRFGIPGLLDPAPDSEKPELRRQRLRDLALYWYNPNPKSVEVEPDLPEEQIDFSSDGPYSLYNWELFFHIPLLIAMRLSQNQRFEEAQRWFHYIFDPTATDSPHNPSHPGPERFWKFKPFYDETRNHKIQTIQELVEDAKKLGEQVKQWQADPFKPHLIARMRIVAYQKAVVMKYIDNLIAWGDQLFRRETLESINEATHLYVLAARMLGKRPEDIPERAETKAQTYNQLRTKLDALSNASAEIEQFLSPSVAPMTQTSEIPLPYPMPYFCIPKNDRMLGYWDTVVDRLYKIRHCMNIEGIVRQLPLFEPPIDPILLVRAAAAGVDIGTVLSDLTAPLPHYRFNYMLQKALEICSEVKSLGAALLSALEKRDAEQLSNIRAGHEVSLLKAARQVKVQQLAEAGESLNGLRKAQELTTIRHQYYANIQYMNVGESTHLQLMEAAQVLQVTQAQTDFVGNIMAQLPNIKIAAPFSAGATFGGDNLGQAIKAYSSYLAGKVSILNASGSMSATIGGYQRRWDDWKLQENLAAKELEQIDRQIAAAEIRQAIAQLELDNHDKQIENAEKIEEFLRDKFTNQELYNWMVGQISSIYFQSYQMVYDIAKRAEKAYRHELGLTDTDSNFIQFGYWDSVRKGLLAGEKLHYDLKRMDVAYLDQNKREYEITRHVSTMQLDPVALLTLRETGRCEISIPEAFFDLDYPGHYLRRIKSVSLSIPCVIGPYTSVNSTLTLLKSSIRYDKNLRKGQYARDALNDAQRFTDYYGSNQSIAVSSGQNDSGLFETNLRDERYLPFEDAGAISTWRLELPTEFRPFDYNTISDVILHMRYTAREGGEVFKQRAREELQAALNELIRGANQKGLVRAFSLSHEFITEWYRFLHPIDAATGQTLLFDLTMERFPFQLRGSTIQIDAMNLFLKLKDGFTYDDGKALAFVLKKEDGTELPASLKVGGSPIISLPYAEPLQGQSGNLGKWSLEVLEDDVKKLDASLPSLRKTVKVNGKDHTRLNPDAIEDVWIVCQYRVA